MATMQLQNISITYPDEDLIFEGAKQNKGFRGFTSLVLKPDKTFVLEDKSLSWSKDNEKDWSIPVCGHEFAYTGTYTLGVKEIQCKLKL